MAPKKTKILIKGAIFVGLVLLIFLLSKYFAQPFSFLRDPGEELDDLGEFYSSKARIIRFLASLGPYAVAVFVLMQAFQVVAAPIPGELTGVLGGYLYGQAFGFLFSTIGLALGSWVAFELARILGKLSMEKFVKKEVVQKFNFLTTHTGAAISFLLFLFPGFSKDYLCFVLGLSGMRLSKFLLVSIMGRMPNTYLLTLQGASIKNEDYYTAVFLTVFAAVTLFLGYLYRDYLFDWLTTFTEDRIGFRSTHKFKCDRQPLKILHIDPEKSWGGGESEVIPLLGYLSLWGHQCHLLCHPAGILLKEAQKRGIKTFPLRIRNDLDMRQVPFLRWLIRREQYDVVHFHTKRAHALSLCLGQVVSDVNFVVTRRMDYPVKRNSYTDYLYNRKVDGIIAVSDKIAEVLAEGGVRSDKIRVVYSGIDPGPYRKAQRTHSNLEKPVIGTAAVLEERKGHQFLLEAAALLRQQGHQLTYRFAGEGSKRECLQKTVLRLGLKDVFFEGFVSDMPRFLSQVDIFVLPSLYEGMGVAVLEAMAARKPVVASRVGGIPELVEHGVTGLLVPPGDPGALANAISTLVSQRGLMKEMGMKACERVQRRFTIEQTAKKIEDYYYELRRVVRKGVMKVEDWEDSANHGQRKSSGVNRAGRDT